MRFSQLIVLLWVACSTVHATGLQGGFESVMLYMAYLLEFKYAPTPPADKPPDANHKIMLGLTNSQHPTMAANWQQFIAELNGLDMNNQKIKNLGSLLSTDVVERAQALEALGLTNGIDVDKVWAGIDTTETVKDKKGNDKTQPLSWARRYAILVSTISARVSRLKQIPGTTADNSYKNLQKAVQNIYNIRGGQQTAAFKEWFKTSGFGDDKCIPTYKTKIVTLFNSDGTTRNINYDILDMANSFPNEGTDAATKDANTAAVMNKFIKVRDEDNRLTNRNHQFVLDQIKDFNKGLNRLPNC